MESNQENSTSIQKTAAIKTPFDYHFMLQYISQQGKNLYGPDFTITDLDKPVITRLLSYFLRDEEVAKSEGIDLNKGIALLGPIGCGKTSLMRIMKGFCSASNMHEIKSCREISFEFGKQGFDTILKYSRNNFHPYTSFPKTYCFDDLGMESAVAYWGNNNNVMGEILLSRYDLFISHKMITHITTNLDANGLEAAYGNRLRSRMRAMFNLINYDNATTDKRR